MILKIKKIVKDILKKEAELYLKKEGKDILVMSDGKFPNMIEIRIRPNGKVSLTGNGNLRTKLN